MNYEVFIRAHAHFQVGGWGHEAPSAMGVRLVRGQLNTPNCQLRFDMNCAWTSQSPLPTRNRETRRGMARRKLHLLRLSVIGVGHFRHAPAMATSCSFGVQIVRVVDMEGLRGMYYTWKDFCFGLIVLVGNI